MERRDFLARGLVAGAALALPGAAAAAPPLPAPAGEKAASGVADRVAGHRVSLGLAGYSFRDILPGRNKEPRMTLERFIDYCAEQDLDGVELTSYFFPRTDEAYLLSLKRRAIVNGLAITGTPVGNNFCLPPGDEREKQIELVKGWIDRAAILGAPTIRIFAGNAPRTADEEQARRWCVECLEHVAEYAGRRGVFLAMENHGGIVATADQVLALHAAYASPWLGINLDTGNFRTRGKDPYEEMEKVAHLAVVTQLKVAVVDAEGKRAPTDVRRVLDILARKGFRGALVLEYEEQEDPLVAVPRHLAELKRLVRGA